MHTLHTLAPIILLLSLGALLTRIRFIGRRFIGELSKLVFWVCLPALMLRSVASAEYPGEQTLPLITVMLLGTFLLVFLSWGVALLIKLPRKSIGTFIQSSFRGNLAYIGIPVIANSIQYLPDDLEQELLQTALLTMAAVTAVYNILAVIVLRAGQGHIHLGTTRLVLRSILTNPLLLACMAGLILARLHWHFPLFLDRTLASLGAASVPTALLCTGGSLATVDLKNSRLSICLAALLKIAIFPLLIFGLCLTMGLTGINLQMALLLAASPAAAASYIMARQMGGDEALASGAIAVSTVFSGASLALVLIFTSAAGG